MFENFNYKDNIKIYANNKLVKFKILYNENNTLKIELDTNYMCENLLFYIDNASNYKITLYQDYKFNEYLISKEIKDEEIFFPDKTWITNKTIMRGHETTLELEESDFTTRFSKYYTCRYREIYVYKYEITREYYDDNYHLNVDGYIKDVDDFKIFYKGKPLTNTIEIVKEKIIKEPQYIYIEKDNNKNDSSSTETTCIPEVKTEIKKEIIEKEIFKIPKKIYLVIVLLVITIIILIIKNIKKNVVRN